MDHPRRFACFLKICLTLLLSVSAIPAADPEPKPPVLIDFDELATSIDQTFLNAENKGSSPVQLELDGFIDEEHLPRIVAGVDGQGAAIQFQGKEGTVAVMRDVEWTEGAWKLSMDFQTDEAQAMYDHMVQITDSDGNKIASIAFVKDDEAMDDESVRGLAVDGPGRGARLNVRHPVTDGQWHGVELEYDPLGGQLGHGLLTARVDLVEIGSFYLREPVTAPSSVTIALGAQAHKHRPYKGSVDNLRIEFPQ